VPPPWVSRAAAPLAPTGSPRLPALPRAAGVVGRVQGLALPPHQRWGGETLAAVARPPGCKGGARGGRLWPGQPLQMAPSAQIRRRRRRRDPVPPRARTGPRAHPSHHRPQPLHGSKGAQGGGRWEQAWVVGMAGEHTVEKNWQFVKGARGNLSARMLCELGLSRLTQADGLLAPSAHTRS
jgi:hypothetical protein